MRSQHAFGRSMCVYMSKGGCVQLRFGDWVAIYVLMLPIYVRGELNELGGPFNNFGIFDI